MNGYYREFDACVKCVKEEKESLENGEFIEVFGYGTTMHIEDMPACCDICSAKLV
jgi:hypothetical protein